MPDIAAAMPTVSKDGLTYTFKVRAQNVVGWGKWSPESPGAMPNAC